MTGWRSCSPPEQKKHCPPPTLRFLPPERFRVLARVVRSDVRLRQSRKKLVLAQTVNVDKIDEKVFLLGYWKPTPNLAPDRRRLFSTPCHR